MDHTPSNEHEVRLQKVRELEKLQGSAWPAFRPVNATCDQVIKHFETADYKPEHVYTVAGRVMTVRKHGKTIFCHIQDRSGRLQLYIKKDIVGPEAFEFFDSYVDIGDIIWAQGVSFKTKMGEITLKVQECALTSKCLHPLPEKFHGLTDVETKYRQRYLDLITNQESRQRFVTRSRVVRQLRNYLDSHDFMEVETPMLHSIPGGAAAQPFVTHHNALDMELFLRIAPELFLKRLVVGGFERVYEINRSFRNEGISTRHNPEFTMLEYYMAHQDYKFAMEFLENMLRSMVEKSCGKLQVAFGDHTIDFEKKFDRINAYQAVLKYTDLTEKDLVPENLEQIFKKHGIEFDKNNSYNKNVFVLFEELAESKLIQPTFIIDFPIEISPLAKRDPENPELASRFELFIAGMEVSNGFSELNDPFDQAERFKEQAKAHGAGDEEAMRYDADYVQALEYALPPTVGVGIGIDRLVMLLTDTTSIKDVILFPTLKKKA